MPALLLLFFLSGAASLAYEVVWMRQLVLIFGATRLPQIGEGLGKGIKNFRGALREPPEIDVTPDKNPDPSTPPNPPDPDGGSSSS